MPQDPFHFIGKALDAYVGRCVGRQGLGLILRRMTAMIVNAGFTTTRIGVPEQNLASGTLRLTLVPGVIRRIRAADDQSERRWASAFPARPGDLLNLRDLEQGLDQLKRVPSQDATMEIVPGEIPGESDVVVTVKRSKSWRISMSLDDSGSMSTGKRQFSTNISYDDPLGLNDLFYLGFNQDADRQKDVRATHGANLYYSVPWGNWTFAWQTTEYNYHQRVAGTTQTFVSSGHSKTHEFKVQHLIGRDQASKTTLQFRTYRRASNAFIDDTEILVQRRTVAAAELAVLHRHHFGDTQMDASYARRIGVPWFNAQQDAAGRTAATPTYQYRIDVVDLALLAPFRLGDLPLRYSGAVHAQYSREPLYLAETLSIGNRYTVRGYDGEQTLAAESGYYWRNDVELPLGNTGQLLYVGLDRGRIFGPGAANLAGDHLSGVALGMRGSGYGVGYDFFVARALQHSALPTRRPVTGFNLTYQF